MHIVLFSGFFRDIRRSYLIPALFFAAKAAPTSVVGLAFGVEASLLANTHTKSNNLRDFFAAKAAPTSVSDWHLA
jgi:hypothetical protein